MLLSLLECTTPVRAGHLRMSSGTSTPEGNKPLCCIQQVLTDQWCSQHPLVSTGPQLSQAWFLTSRTCSEQPCNPPMNYLLKLTRVSACFLQLKNSSGCNTALPLFLIHWINRHTENLWSAIFHARNCGLKYNQNGSGLVVRMLTHLPNLRAHT